MATTVGLMIYGFLRFSMVTAPDGSYGAEFSAGDRLILDRFPSHGRDIGEGDWVVFEPRGSGPGGGQVLAKVLVAPSADENEAAKLADLKRVFPGKSEADIAVILGLNAGPWPGPGSFLLGIELPREKKGKGELFLEWAAKSGILGRVIMRSPF